MADAAFALETRPDGPVVRARTAHLVGPSVRRLAWFVVVAGLTGLAGLAVLRAPAAVDGVFFLFWLGSAALVWSDSRHAALRFEGEIKVDVPNGRLTRLSGLAALGWTDLRLPPRAVLVLKPVPGWDGRRWIAGQERPVRLSAVPEAHGAEALWQAAAQDQLPDGVTVVPGADYDVSRGLAEALARAFSWPLFDLTAAAPERRDPEDLQRPLQERLAALASPADDPPRSRPWGVTSWDEPAAALVAVRTFGLAGLIAQMALAVPMLALLYIASGGNLAIPMLGAALLALAAGGRTHVELTPRRVAIRPFSAWMPLGAERILAWEEVEQLQVVEDRGAVGVRFVTDGGSVFVPAPSRVAARWAAATIRSYLRHHA
jgi:hypothetical protein